MRNKFKILLFIPSLEGGGAEKVCQILANYLAKEGYDIYLATVHPNGVFRSNLLKSVNTKIFYKKTTFSSFKSLNLYIDEIDPDVIISFMESANLLLIFCKLISKIKFKLIITSHCSIKYSIRSSFKNKILFFLVKYFYHHADIRVGVSNGVSLEFDNFCKFLTSKSITVYNPIDIPVRKLIPKSDESIYTILSVGRLEPQKDFNTLIKAFSYFLNFKSARLIILGEGQCRNELSKLIIDLNLTESVIMPGFVENVDHYYSMANMFVMSSIFEGFGNVIVEALNFGLPIVSTDCDWGPSEILDHGKYGILVPKGDPIRLCEAMVHTSKSNIDPEIQIRRGAEFSTQNACNKYINLILS